MTTLLDGAMGTALHARGLAPERFPEEWLLERPQEVARVHAAHVGAGAEIVLSCTFNAARLDLRGLSPETESFCQRAVALARGAGPRAVAGCVGATGLVGPRGEGAADGELRERFSRAFRALGRAGAALLWTETHVSLREARAALAAARSTGLKVVATLFLAEGAGGMAALDGTPGEECLGALWSDGAAAVGVNCVEPGPSLAALVARAVARIAVPIAVKASAPRTRGASSPELFAAAFSPALSAGASLCGGCCGTGAHHLRALRRAMARARPL